jgi:hypothetical protein
MHDFFPGAMHRYAAKYCEILKTNGIGYEITNCLQVDFWDKVKQAQLFIYFLGQTPLHLQQQRTLINTIDRVLQIPCMPDWNTAWHFDDKIAEYYLMLAKGFPAVHSWIFWDKVAALVWADNAVYPVVFKLKGGAGSLNVAKVNNVNHSMRLINLMFGKGITNGSIPGINLFSVYKRDFKRILKNQAKLVLQHCGMRYGRLENWDRERNYVFFQQFLAHNEYDTRVTIIGDKAFAFIRRNRPADFRSSGSGLLEFEPEKVDRSMVKIAFAVSDKLNFQTMAYDFLYDNEEKPVINEFSCQFADWAVYSCPGYWDNNLNWHEGHFWPQYIQLQQLLEKEDLVQPDFPLYKGSQNLIKY